MPNFSDGDDSVDASAMSDSINHIHGLSSSGDMRLHLQNLLDSKEKQLQQAGTLGQQLLAQRMELEERIRQLQELDLDGATGDDDLDMGVRERYRELADTIKTWEDENEQLSSTFGWKPAVNGTQMSPASRHMDLSRSDVERSVDRSKAAASGPSAAQSSRRAKNAAHRADDVEFAFEIGSGLLTEVRRLQSLLAERDKAIQDMKEEKDDLEKSIESLRQALRQQEQSADKFKEENWNQEVTLQELRSQLADSQAATQRLESEHKRLTKMLTATRESVDQHKNEAEKHQNAYNELKIKHETDVAHARRQAASLQRDKSDLQQTVDSMKAEVAKAKRFPRFGSPLTPNGLSVSGAVTPAGPDEDDVFGTTGGASTNNRKKLDSSMLFPDDAFGPDYADESPDPSPSKPFLAPNHPSNEIEALQQRLAHAQRQINTLKSTLQREKELRMEYRRKLDAAPAQVAEETDEFIDEEADETAKPKPRLTPYRSSRGRGRGRGRGKGSFSLTQRLGMAANSPSSEYGGDFEELDESSPPPPVPALPVDLQSEVNGRSLVSEDQSDEEPDVQASPTPQVASNRTSVDGMDPIFANVLRRTGSNRSIPSSSSPLRRSITVRSRGTAFPRRSRGGAAYQETRPPSLVGVPEALAAELGLGTSDMDVTLEEPEPEPAVETAEFGCQTEFEEPVAVPLPPVQVSPPTAEMAVQVEPEPVTPVETTEFSIQTDEEPVVPAPVRSEIGIQHENLEPAPPIVIHSEVGIQHETVVPEPPAVVHSEAGLQYEDIDPPSIVIHSDAGIQYDYPEPPAVLHSEAGIQHEDVDPISPPIVHSEAGIQHESIVPVPPTILHSEAGIQYESIADPSPPVILSDNGVQHEGPTVTSVSTSTSTEDDSTPVQESHVSAHAESQTITPATMDVETQTTPEPPSFHFSRDATVVLNSLREESLSMGDSSGDTTIHAPPSSHPAEFHVPPDDDDDDDTTTETGSVFDTDTDDYQDARQSMSMATPTDTQDDFHSIMTVTDNDFSESDDDDAESIKASRLSSRQGWQSTSALTSAESSPVSVPDTPQIPPRTYESKAVSADLIEELKPEEVKVEEPKLEPKPEPLPEPKPEVKEMSIQTDDWSPSPVLPPPVLPPTPGPPQAPTLYRVGVNSQQFQFISPPSSAGPTTTTIPIASPVVIASPSPNTTIRESTIIARPRTSHSDRRQSIDSTLSSVMEDIGTRSRTPSTAPNGIDKSRPPMMMLPPPPRQPPPPNAMLPPAFIPEKKTSSNLGAPEVPPPRPSSPPPPELIQRATTPLGNALGVPGSRNFGLRHHGSSMAPTQASLRELPSTSSFRSHASPRAPLSSPSAVSFGVRDRQRQGFSQTSLNSGAQSIGSQRSSLSSDHHLYDEQSQRLANGPTTPERNADMSTRSAGAASTDPMIIHAITQTMIGEFLYKYTRRTIGKGHGSSRHKRFFWVHPYTRTLYWSSADPGSSNVAESSAKSAYIESVKSVLDPNPMPPGLHQYSVIVSTPQREMKFTAPTKERHEIWLNALQYLLTRPSAMPVSSPGKAIDSAPLSPMSLGQELPEDDAPNGRNWFGSPQSQRSARSGRTAMSTDSWNITPRGQRSHSQLSSRGSMGKRSGTPAAEYLRWAAPDGAQSPTKDFEHIPAANDEEDLDFELHEERMSDEGFDGLENVRACCDGRHTVGRAGGHDHHHHHHHDHPQHVHQESVGAAPTAVRRDHLDAHPRDTARPASPAWSFRSRAGSSTSHDGAGFFSRFGTKRSTKTMQSVSVGGDHQS